MDGEICYEPNKHYSSREIISLLEADGWYEVHCVGSHHQFKHPTKKGKVTVKHPVKDYCQRTFRSMMKQAQIKPVEKKNEERRDWE